EKPYAYLIPEGQGDRLRVAQMVNRLLDQRIEVGRLPSALSLKEGTFPKGTYLVKLDQPYRNYAVDVLEPQRFPAESANLPYGVGSWASPVGFGVSALRTEAPAVQSVSPVPLAGEIAPAGQVAGDGPAFLLEDTGQESLLAARFRLAGFKVEIAEKAFALGG